MAASPPRRLDAAADWRDRWRPTPRTLVVLMIGLWLFGTGEACLVASTLGVSPWTVFAQGLSRQTALSIGTATIATSAAVLLAWVPLRQAPGLGTIANAIVVGLAIDVSLTWLPAHPHGIARPALVAGGIGLVALGSGLYLTTGLGPGPRDGLMTGLSARTGRSLRLVRGSIELCALVAGAILGGTVGIGTVAFAVLVGPGVQAAVQRFSSE